MKSARESRELDKIKSLEAENKRLKFQLDIFNMFRQDNETFSNEVTRLLGFLEGFITWSKESDKLLTKREKADLKKGDPATIGAIFEKLASHPIAQADRKENEGLTSGNEIIRIRKLIGTVTQEEIITEDGSKAYRVDSTEGNLHKALKLYKDWTKVKVQKGGEGKFNNGLTKFRQFLKEQSNIDKGFSPVAYKESSNHNLREALKQHGFIVAEKTARKYLNTILKETGK